jgi:hypothetical protein
MPMSNHRNQIASLRELIDSGLSGNNLDRLAQGCAVLARETPDPAVFFVLGYVFREMSSLWDNGPVKTVEFDQFTAGIADGAKRLLDGNQETKASDLEAFVHQHIQNVILFEANRARP